jgi:hypothetical protein
MLRAVLRPTLLVCLLSCTCGESDVSSERDTNAVEDEPELVEAPARLLFVASLGGGGEWLEGTREVAATGPLRLVWPLRPGEILDRFAPRLGVGEHVPSDAPVFAAALEGRDGSRIALAARTDLDSESVEALRLCSDERPERPCGAVFGHMVVVADDRATLDELGPFLAYGAHARVEPPSGLVIDVARAGVSLFRADLESMVENGARGLMSAATRERQEHTEPPALGDPEALVRAGERRLQAMIERLGEVERARVLLSRRGESMELSLELVLEGALRDEIARAPERDLGVLARSLPDSTAFAIATTAALDPPALAADVLSVAGERLDENESGRVRAFVEAHGEAIDGEGRVLVAGGVDRGGWVVFASDRAADPPDLGAAIELARLSYARTVGEAMFDCSLAPSRDGPSAIRLCREAEGPSLVAVDRERSFARWLLLRGGDEAHRAALADAFDAPEQDRALAVVRIEASRALAFGASTARRSASDYALGDPSPVTVAITRAEGRLEARTALDRRTLGAVFAAVAPLVGLGEREPE